MPTSNVKTLKATNTDLQAGRNTNKKTSQVDSQADILLTGNANEITLKFAPGVTDFSGKIKEDFDKLIGSYANADQWDVSMQADASEASPSEGQRLSFYRMALVRNHLVANKVSPSKIKSVIRDTPVQRDRGHVVVRITRAP